MKPCPRVTKFFILSAIALVISTATPYAAPAISVGKSAAIASPEGIIIKVIRIGRGINPPGSNSNQPRDRIVFADMDGNVLYASPHDSTIGVSSCNDECIKTWVPLLASNGAEPVGFWSAIPRNDGTSQWTFKGKPMYRYSEELEKPKGEEQASARRTPDGKGHDVDGRYVMEINPSTWMALPMGITVEEVRAASGQVLSTTSGRSLYFFSGDVKSITPNSDWIPVEAGQAMLPVGDFTIVKRADGIFQWAFQDMPLYTYRDDREYGDANGLFAADERFQLSYVLRYFMPNVVQVRKNHTYGGLLETTDGRTLYARERGNGGVDAVYRGDRGRLGIGQSLGVKTCDAECEETWKPLLANLDAKPTGYWGVYDRPDGAKQWAYYGYALYTYEGIEDMGSVEVYDDVDHFEVADGTPNTGIPLHWRVAPP